MKLKVEDYLPGEFLSPMLDGTNAEGKFKTRKGIMAMKKGTLQVQGTMLPAIKIYSTRGASQTSIFGTRSYPTMTWKNSHFAGLFLFKFVFRFSQLTIRSGQT